MAKDLVEKLIVKFLSRSISDQEMEQLNALMHHRENQKAFKDFVKIDYYSVKKMVDTEWETDRIKVLERFKEMEPHTDKVRKVRYYRYAIAACIAVLITVSISILGVGNDDSAREHESIVAAPITPGFDKAILTLEDGKEVALEKGKKYTDDQINSDGESLYYNSEEEGNDAVSYNYLTIPRGGQFYLELSDGTKVWLNSESRIKYPVKFPKDKDRVVEMVYGEAYFDVSHSSLHNGAAFKVLNVGQEVAVLGTEFNIRAYKDKNQIYTTLVDGKVMVRQDENSVVLEPGQQTLFEGAGFKTASVDVESVTAWKNGYFDFKNMALGDMMEELSRWYDFEPHFENPEKRSMTFSGRLNRYDDLNELLKLIEATGTISFQGIENGTLKIE